MSSSGTQVAGVQSVDTRPLGNFYIDSNKTFMEMDRDNIQRYTITNLFLYVGKWLAALGKVLGRFALPLLPAGAVGAGTYLGLNSLGRVVFKPETSIKTLEITVIAIAIVLSLVTYLISAFGANRLVKTIVKKCSRTDKKFTHGQIGDMAVTYQIVKDANYTSKFSGDQVKEFFRQSRTDAVIEQYPYTPKVLSANVGVPGTKIMGDMSKTIQALDVKFRFRQNRETIIEKGKDPKLANVSKGSQSKIEAKTSERRSFISLPFSGGKTNGVLGQTPYNKCYTIWLEVVYYYKEAIFHKEKIENSGQEINKGFYANILGAKDVKEKKIACEKLLLAASYIERSAEILGRDSSKYTVYNPPKKPSLKLTKSNDVVAQTTDLHSKFETELGKISVRLTEILKEVEQKDEESVADAEIFNE